MGATKTNARQRLIDKIHGFAVKNFAEHKIEQRLSQGMYRSWRCAKADSCEFAFEITTLPGTLLVTGDIGELIVQRTEDMLAWAERAVYSIDYFAGKVPHALPTTQWCPDVAWEWLEELAAEEVEEEEDKAERVEKIADLRSCLEDGSDAFFRELSDSRLIDGCDYPDLTNWTSNFLWCREAVIWFIERKEAET